MKRLAVCLPIILASCATYEDIHEQTVTISIPTLGNDVSLLTTRVFSEPTREAVFEKVTPEQRIMLEIVKDFEAEHGFEAFGKTGFVYDELDSFYYLSFKPTKGFWGRKNFVTSHLGQYADVRLRIDLRSNEIVFRDMDEGTSEENSKLVSRLAKELYERLARSFPNAKMELESSVRRVRIPFDLA